MRAGDPHRCSTGLGAGLEKANLLGRREELAQSLGERDFIGVRQSAHRSALRGAHDGLGGPRDPRSQAKRRRVPPVRSISQSPAAVLTRQPDASVMCVGPSFPAPNIESGRLLPVDVPPGMTAAARGAPVGGHASSVETGTSVSSGGMPGTSDAGGSYISPARAALERAARLAFERSLDLDRHRLHEIHLARRGFRARETSDRTARITCSGLRVLKKSRRSSARWDALDGELAVLDRGRGGLPCGAAAACVCCRRQRDAAHMHRRGSPARGLSDMVLGGRDADHGRALVQRLVREAMILAAKEHCHRSRPPHVRVPRPPSRAACDHRPAHRAVLCRRTHRPRRSP